MAKNVSLGIEANTLRDLVLGKTTTVQGRDAAGVEYVLQAVNRPDFTGKSAPDLGAALQGLFPSVDPSALQGLVQLLGGLLGAEGTQIVCDELAKSATGDRERWLEKAAAATDHDLRAGYLAKAGRR